MCVQIMGKNQQARFELLSFPHHHIDRGSHTLSHKQNTHKISKFGKIPSSAAQFSHKSG